MITWWLSVVLPVLAGIWSIFVAKTGRLVPLGPGRKRKALSAAKDKARGYEENWTGDKAGQNVSKELALPKEPEPVFELFDHPAPPIPLLKASMPSPPLGYGWEIFTLSNDAGNPALRLAMLDLKTSAVIDAIEADLVIARRWKYANDDTYAMLYRKAEQQCAWEITGYQTHGSGSYRQRTPIYGKDPQELKGKVMMANLVTPMVDWARLITLRYIVDHPDETKCNYVLVEATEGVNA